MNKQNVNTRGYDTKGSVEATEKGKTNYFSVRLFEWQWPH